MRDLDLLLRHRQLLRRSLHLRGALARDARTLVLPLTRIGALGRSLARMQPARLALFAVPLLLVGWRLRSSARLALRLWWAWQGWRSLRQWLGD